MATYTNAALLSVVKQGTSADRRAALPRLLKTGNPDALALAIQFASKGSRNERYEAMRMLADAGSPKAFDALIDIAGKARGQTRIQALEMVAQAHLADPAVGQLLTDALFSGRRDESQYAASILGRIGTVDRKAEPRAVALEDYRRDRLVKSFNLHHAKMLAVPS